jgi:hypothetical protein
VRDELFQLLCKLPSLDTLQERRQLLLDLDVDALAVDRSGSPRDFAGRLIDAAAAQGRSVLDRLVAQLGVLPSLGVDVRARFAQLAGQISELTHEQWELDFDQEGHLWGTVAQSCHASLGRFPARDDLYVRREIEAELDGYLESDKTMMVIVGPSGMGKTTLLGQSLRRYAQGGHLCFFISSAGLPAPTDAVQPRLVSLLTGGGCPAGFFPIMERKCARRGRVLLVAIDAINEYNRANAGAAPGPVDFLTTLDSLAASLKSDRHRYIKYLVTMRPETWKRGVENDRVRVDQSSDAYWVCGGQIEQRLGRYTGAEASAAYANYARVYDLRSQLHKLPEVTRYHLRDPLLLTLAAEIYRGDGVPGDLETDALFGRYHDHVAARCPAAPGLLGKVVRSMFRAESCVITTDTVVRDGRLRELDRDLHESLDPQRSSSLGAQLSELNVLRFYDDRIRFTYDRFVEYLLARELLARIAARGKSVEVAFGALRDNLDSPYRLNTVSRALRRALRQLQREPRYRDLVPRLARSGERGLELVVSVMGSIAMRSGASGLHELLARLRRDVDRASMMHAMLGRFSPLGTVFPVIDAVHRLIVDEEYSLWRDDPANGDRVAHLQPLYDAFAWGLGHRSASINAAAIQYLFFLWNDPATRAHAAAITDLVVSAIRPPSLWTVFRQRQKRLLQNVSCIFLLTISEAMAVDGQPASLQQARAFIARLKLDRARLLAVVRRLADMQAQYLTRMFERLPNPINHQELIKLYADPASKSQVRAGLHLVRRAAAGLPLPLEEVRALLGATNSYALQLLCYALSVAYERSSGPVRLAHVGMLRALFEGGLEPQGEYCVALAMYHLNYFGAEATLDTIALMGEMTDHILRERRGRFVLSGRPYNFNIVGTYGRVLRKHRALLVNPRQVSRTPMLRYALESLADATRRTDAEYYRYVCDNIGLLGVLTAPDDVFEVMAHVLGRLAEPRGPAALPFSEAETAAVRKTIIQSFANIRVLYRPQVDRWILEEREDQALYAEVTQRIGQFELPTFYSWVAEHLMFRLLTTYHEKVGAELIDALERALDQTSAPAGVRYVLTSLYKRLIALSGPP